jgi:hypothetical protein
VTVRALGTEPIYRRRTGVWRGTAALANCLAAPGLGAPFNIASYALLT